MPASAKTPRKRLSARRPASLRDAVVMPDTAALVAVLQAHALGEYEMTATQVNVALSLLKLYADHVPAPSRAHSHEDALASLD